ncbi:MAG: hypothetical protein KME10_01745 [Plectolyngbya sp. WJT66-NPBG17]|jgi:hypothetical protein|nr:hypothetical protein [Plectolyngbya sp. WJT66-NPBG17]MBW4523903.1 hypothetical protein [Phormidium tanganyikae FI6-MK23]
MRPTPLTDSRPKISTMPRPQTEATAYLNLYKLSIEKKRLQYELDSIDQRRHRIQKRLSFLESQVAEMQQSAPVPKLVPVTKNSAPDSALNTLFLEY